MSNGAIVKNYIILPAVFFKEFLMIHLARIDSTCLIIDDVSKDRISSNENFEADLEMKKFMRIEI